MTLFRYLGKEREKGTHSAKNGKVKICEINTEGIEEEFSME